MCVCRGEQVGVCRGEDRHGWVCVCRGEQAWVGVCVHGWGWAGNTASLPVSLQKLTVLKGRTGCQLIID